MLSQDTRSQGKQLHNKIYERIQTLHQACERYYLQALNNKKDVLMEGSGQVSSVEKKANRDDMLVSLEQQQDLVMKVYKHISIIKEAINMEDNCDILRSHWH